MIKTLKLKKIYTTEEVETTALNDINLEVKEGEYVAIMGPSGCGKSTLLNILGMIDKASSGEYYFLAEEVSKYSERKRASIRKNNIGFVFQSFNLIDELTVYENVELPLLYLGYTATDRKKRVTEVLEQMQLMARKNHFPQQLSGGQQQRVAVARAVVARPKLILADEPTGQRSSDSSSSNPSCSRSSQRLQPSAWPVAYFAMNKWLQNFAYRISIGIWTFVLSGLIALVLALLTVSYQSIKAALANPVQSLRYE
jgi:putative ABC transport system ATP-binding protein